MDPGHPQVVTDLTSVIRVGVIFLLFKFVRNTNMLFYNSGENHLYFKTKQNIEMLKEMKEVSSFKGHHLALGKGSMPPPTLGREASSDFRESVGGIARAVVPSRLREQVQSLNAALQLTSCGLAEIPPAF